MNELLFETYRVPAVAAGIDSVFSAQHNGPDGDLPQYGVIVSSSHSASHVLPIVEGKIDFKNVKRIDVGGNEMTEFTEKLLHLQHPLLRPYVTPVQAEELKHRFCYLTGMSQYLECAKHLASNPVDVIQVPFTPAAVPSQAELDQKYAARREQGLRLQELTANKRREKLAADRLKLGSLVHLKLKEKEGTTKERAAFLSQEGYKSERHLQKAIDELADRVSPAQLKSKEGLDLSLADVDEKSLNPKEKLEKHVQLQLKAATVRRQIMLKKREEALAQHKKEERALAQLQKDDPEKWKAQIKAELEVIYLRRERRKKLRQDLNDRGSVAYRRRQKMINDAANMDGADEDFGVNDDDWLVYAEMSAGRDGVDEEDEDDEQRINELETMLADHDPTSLYLTYEEQAKQFQLQLGALRARVSECLFQPSMIGVDQAGLIEALESTLKCYSQDVQAKMAENIMLSGGNMKIEGMRERLQEEIQALRPAGSNYTLQTAKDPMLDSWYGARQHAISDTFAESCVTLAEYEECGGNYLKEHRASNLTGTSGRKSNKKRKKT